MREILYKNLTSIEKGRRIIAVSETSENKESRVHVQKALIYIIAQKTAVPALYHHGTGPADPRTTEISQPVFHIFKSYDTKTKAEKFSFRVKGIFYLVEEKHFRKVHFCHSLRIDIIHKSKLPIS